MSQKKPPVTSIDNVRLIQCLWALPKSPGVVAGIARIVEEDLCGQRGARSHGGPVAQADHPGPRLDPTGEHLLDKGIKASMQLEDISRIRDLDTSEYY